MNRDRASPALDTMRAMGTMADVRIPMWPLTVDAFERMVDAGILAADDRVELLNGQLAKVSPQGPQHSGIAQWLASQLIRAIDPVIAGVRVQLPMRLAPLSEPEPDVAIVPPGFYTHEHPTWAMLVVEIAKSSRSLDLGVKAEVYAAAEVAAYWVIDIAARTVHVHRSPAGGAYGSLRRVTSGSIRPDVPGAPPIDVETLFSLLD
jgi:Uma2 family endonuclease